MKHPFILACLFFLLIFVASPYLELGVEARPRIPSAGRLDSEGKKLVDAVLFWSGIVGILGLTVGAGATISAGTQAGQKILIGSGVSLLIGSFIFAIARFVTG